ncbi:anthranilate synthase family protein [Desulfogranum japonicum]|uniref:anthranilate synthase family protein n=1 Tax=Desulfogranum japonicum TaxID=231447 RepID=UPI000422EBD8|nr:anthranilate synthase family protein [Desulfogranum japonicum]
MDNIDFLLSSASPAFALIQRQDSDEIYIFTGRTAQFNSVHEIPRNSQHDSNGQLQHHTLSVVPFHQVSEKGYQTHQGDERIRTLLIDTELRVRTDTLLALLPDNEISLSTPLHFTTTEKEYADIIRAIIEDEIGQGEGANFVIPRDGMGCVKNFDRATALSIFRKLVANDYGTYWKFLVWDEQGCFVGSTPERHLEVRKGNVKMNPISGTFRKNVEYECRQHFKDELMHFLRDQKEINELFMVVDEELKMMARMCDKGGAIIGPLIKEMSRLIHTEYLLSGQSDKDLIELFIDSMYAATVVGSPVENACRIIKKYSQHSRRYYGSALLLMGRDEQGMDFLDSPITIRTLDFSHNGTFHISVGATLVRDSNPTDEVDETRAKGAAVLSCLEKGNVTPQPRLMSRLANDDSIAEELVLRNQKLSKFWFYQQSAFSINASASKYTISLIQNNDDFIYMLSHILQALGHITRVTSWEDYVFSEDTADIVLLGPGPGNPTASDVKKMHINTSICSQILNTGKPALFVCLGHQILCQNLGYTIKRMPSPMQGIQVAIDFFGRSELVGFYNTFVATHSGEATSDAISFLDGSNRIAALRGSHYAGFQFHPESLLTSNGAQILAESIDYIMR